MRKVLIFVARKMGRSMTVLVYFLLVIAISTWIMGEYSHVVGCILSIIGGFTGARLVIFLNNHPNL